MKSADIEWSWWRREGTLVFSADPIDDDVDDVVPGVMQRDMGKGMGMSGRINCIVEPPVKGGGELLGLLWDFNTASR